jgi:hypothetical protein
MAAWCSRKWAIIEQSRALYLDAGTFISCRDREMNRDLRALFASRATDVIEISGNHSPTGDDLAR